MSSLFITILNMSFGAGCAALIVLIIRLALRKAPKIYSYALWAVVFFRLLVPFSIRLPVSAIPVQPQAIPRDFVYSASPSIQSGLPAVDHAVNTALESALPAGHAFVAAPAQTALAWGAYLWLAGTLALLIYALIGFVRLKKRVHTAIRVCDNVYETDQIKTPFVLGFFRPRIYIPTGLSPEETVYVLAHERVHIRRLDHLVKPAAFLAASVHWFNPVAWVSYALLTKDMELSADERVLRQCGNDIRVRYSNSLLALSVKSSGLLNPLAFGETGVRARIRNILCYKKPTFWVTVTAIAVVAVVSLILLVSRPVEKKAETPAGQSAAPGTVSASVTQPSASSSKPSETVYQTSYERVIIELLSENKGFKTKAAVELTDRAAVARIDHTLTYSMTHSDETNLKNNYTNEYTIKLSNKTGGYSAGLYYDTLYNKAYIVNNGSLFETDTDFARYIDSLLENNYTALTVEDAEAVSLFSSYGWTLDYRINAMKNKLNDITVLTAFNPNAYYFAYSNELSKDIGLDMSGYSDTGDINVVIYRIHEQMPQEFYPIQNCRGVVVKSGSQIIGAFVSAGRHSTFNACSLAGHSFERVTGQTLNNWLAYKVKADSTEERLSKLAPEQIIEEYIRALNDKNAEAAEYCVSKQNLLENLSSNMPDGELFNEGISLPLTFADIGSKGPFDNLKSAKLLKAEASGDTDQNTKTFSVYVDLQYNKDVTISSGEQYWDCAMVYESPQTGWKIVGFGHG